MNTEQRALQETSDHAYLLGYEGFLLDFSKENGQENLQNFTKFSRLTKDILDIFFCRKTHDLGVLQRAWLCFGDYSIEMKDNREPDEKREDKDNWFFGNRYQVEEFRYRNPVFKLFANTPYFCNLLDHLAKLGATRANLVEKMCSIVADYTQQKEQLVKRSWWEQCLLQDEELFKYINTNQQVKECGCIKIEIGKEKEIEEGRVYLLKGQRKVLKKKNSSFTSLLGYVFYNYCKKEVLEGLGTFEGGELGQRQFAVKDGDKEFPVIIEHKSIKLVSPVNEDTADEDTKKKNMGTIPIKFKNTDIFKVFERAMQEIQKIIYSKHPDTPINNVYKRALHH
ncbi:hypothetical protein BN341_11310 [Helicobacter heilmannii ASB1.4]|uniref:Uncharacterized protein n=1 Tax=Helicobacter heilmannii TaxID=35817 RepID=A0A0K2Y8R6_HELHE|nr:hypothetical protein BN341_11310 [Helicobacter heilmannii ASB1.4]CRI34537.1 hypothetical protein HHE01_03380 [Helicobacter heilmannii]